jgi:ribonuclease P protein component
VERNNIKRMFKEYCRQTLSLTPCNDYFFILKSSFKIKDVQDKKMKLEEIKKEIKAFTKYILNNSERKNRG